MGMRCYIIGAVTGLPREAVVSKFDKAALSVKSAGMIPVNPIELVPEDTNWVDAMKICIRHLITCDAIMLTPGWEESRGGRLEQAIATELGLPEFIHNTVISKL